MQQILFYTKQKSNEFYTQLSDIESELKHYGDHFDGKVVYCNCDDPRVSNFFNYFFVNFERLWIKKIITAYYKKQEYNILNVEEPKNGFFFVYSGEKGGKNKLIRDNSVPFEGDGDFRSNESVALLNQCDIVVTNPPFSLFREYVDQLVKYEKNFLIIGNINAITTRKYLR